MTQIFVLGASIVYGVGSEDGGWADMLKRKIHQRMYSKDGTGEKFEMYNFAKPGATAEFVLDTFDYQIDKYKGKEKPIVILSVGVNNSKAVDRADNFVSTLPEYKEVMQRLLQKIKAKTDKIICVGFSPVDENKTNPKQNPITGGKSYFWNQRLSEFNYAFKQACDVQGVKFIDLDVNIKEWIKNCLFKDGLHPNGRGHQYIFEKVYDQLEKLL